MSSDAIPRFAPTTKGVMQGLDGGSWVRYKDHERRSSEEYAESGRRVQQNDDLEFAITAIEARVRTLLVAKLTAWDEADVDAMELAVERIVRQCRFEAYAKGGNAQP